MKNKLYLKTEDIPVIRIVFIITLLVVIGLVYAAPNSFRLYIALFFGALIGVIILISNSDNSNQKQARFLIIEDDKLTIINKNKSTTAIDFSDIQSVNISGYWGLTPELTFKGAAALIKINIKDDFLEFRTDVMPSVIEFLKVIKKQNIMTSYNSKETELYLEKRAG